MKQSNQDNLEFCSGDGAKAIGKSKKKKVGRLSVTINIVLIFLIAVLAFLIIFMNVFTLCPISQESMTPTLRNDQRVLLLKTKNVKNGDIFVFKTDIIDTETGKYKNLIKRVMGCSGDRLLFVTSQGRGIVDDRIVCFYRDSGDGFTLLDEKYIKDTMRYIDTPQSDYCRIYEYSGEADKLIEDDKIDLEQIAYYIVTVPSGYYYAMGDNRNSSNDSRSNSLGFVNKNDVIGKVSIKLTEGSFLEGILMFLYGDKRKPKVYNS